MKKLFPFASIFLIFSLWGCSSDPLECGDDQTEIDGACVDENGTPQPDASLDVDEADVGTPGAGDTGDEDDVGSNDTGGTDPVDGECGTRAQSYYLQHRQWPEDETFCVQGILADADPSFPGPGASTEWSCEGSSGGQTAQCSASRSEDCSADRQPPEGWTQLTNCVRDYNYPGGWHPDADCSTWTGIWNSPFWQAIGTTRRLAQNRNSPYQYLAIELSTADMPPSSSGRFNREHDPAFDGLPIILASISRCPGDFHYQPIMDETGCFHQFTSISGTQRWGGVDASEDCKLESDEAYFWNLIATTDDPGTDPDEMEPHFNCLDDKLCGGVYEPQ